MKRKDILNFFGVYQYMGLVRLPSKEDYFENDGNWPIHPLMAGLKQSWFSYLFRFIHLTEDGPVDVEEPTFADQLDDDTYDDDAAETDVADEGDVADCDQEREVDNRWYSKAAPIIDKLIEISQRICVHTFFCSCH